MVAFSGGKDSAFLLLLAQETLGKENVKAVNVASCFTSSNDRVRLDFFISKLNVEVEELNVDLTHDHEVMSNQKYRCYHCKKKIFSLLKKTALAKGIDAIVDGTTYSDLDQFRPGMKALEELGIISPLLEAGITSAEIVKYLSDTMSLDPFYVTSSACLATRFPYDFPLDANIQLIELFDRIESYLLGVGIFPVKVRYIQDGIRIETPQEMFPRILNSRDIVIKMCHEKGLKFITLDIEGIKTGVWD